MYIHGGEVQESPRKAFWLEDAFPAFFLRIVGFRHARIYPARVCNTFRHTAVSVTAAGTAPECPEKPCKCIITGLLIVFRYHMSLTCGSGLWIIVEASLSDYGKDGGALRPCPSSVVRGGGGGGAPRRAVLQLNTSNPDRFTRRNR